jgi:hypothetical protein
MERSQSELYPWRFRRLFAQTITRIYAALLGDLMLILQAGELRERLHKKAELFLFVNAKNLKKVRPPPRYRWSAVEKRASRRGHGDHRDWEKIKHPIPYLSDTASTQR